MRIFHGVDHLPQFRNGALTIGTFDGVHTGHQEIIRRINKAAADMLGESIILTFHPHPRMVLHQDDDNLRLINTLEEKTALLEKYGTDNLIITPFSATFSNMTAEQYVEDFLWKKIRPRKVIIGYDHHFGKNRSGNISLLTEMGKKLGFEVEEIEAQTIENISVSSTKIRKALMAGDVETANILLGHFYSISGKVVSGENIGTSLGFPTANIQVRDQHKLIPANGVYAVRVGLDEQIFKGMMNIGLRPTFNGAHQTIEVHLFDFSKDVYGMEIVIEPVAFIRQEMKFDSSNDLITQLQKDKTASGKILNSSKSAL